MIANNQYGLTQMEKAIFDAMVEKKFMTIDEIVSLTPSGGKARVYDGRVKTTISHINKKIKESGVAIVNYRWLGYSLESQLFEENLEEFGLTTTSHFLLELFFHKGKLSHNEIVGFLERRELKKKINNSRDNRPSVYVYKINNSINSYGLCLKSIHGYGYELCNINTL